MSSRSAIALRMVAGERCGKWRLTSARDPTGSAESMYSRIVAISTSRWRASICSFVTAGREGVKVAAGASMRPVPAVAPRLLALLGRVWPRIPPAVARADALGFSWAAISTPFVHYEGDRAVAHVGVIELPLVIGGRHRMVASIHAVCTDADRRRQGHASALMEAALTHCRVRYGTVVLTTLIPEFYARHGFRTVAEHAFTRPVTPAVSPAGGRRLTTTPDDARLLRRLLARRTAVSARLGTLETGTVFVF